MSFVQRKIDLTFTLQNNQVFDATTGADTVKLSGLRVSATLSNGGKIGMGTCSLRIYGMTFSQMNTLSTLGQRITEVGKNLVQVDAGDSLIGMSLLFFGTITNAYPEFNGMPETAFIVEAQAGYNAAITPVAPVSYPGHADVAVIIANIATVMGRQFENNGVSVTLTDVYLHGTAFQQWLDAKEMANIEGYDDGKTLSIWPINGSRMGAATVLSPSTIMKGYPSFNSAGISLSVLFTPQIRFGATIDVQSELPAAQGVWKVQILNYNLEAETPDGAWFQDIEAVRPTFFVGES
jgi:hypothetical protein